MEDSFQILDSQFDSVSEVKNVEEHVASATKRFLNYVIDYACVFLFFMIAGVIIGLTGNQDKLEFLQNKFVDTLCTYTVYALYTTFFELLTGKSIGKLITKTKVVTIHGSRPTFFNLLGRNIARFIPFNPLSFLGSRPVGWHDKISDTRVIND